MDVSQNSSIPVACGVLDYNVNYSLKPLCRIIIVPSDKTNIVIAWCGAVLDWNCQQQYSFYFFSAIL